MLKESMMKLEECALNPAKAIAAIKEECGKDAVGCFPIYTPEEIVYAGGFVPVGLWGCLLYTSQMDIAAQGRTAQKMGIDGMNLEQLMEYVTN